MAPHTAQILASLSAFTRSPFSPLYEQTCRHSSICGAVAFAQTSLKRGLIEEGHEATVIAESRILSNFSKPNLFVPTQLLTLQDAKVRCKATPTKWDIPRTYKPARTKAPRGFVAALVH